MKAVVKMLFTIIIASTCLGVFANKPSGVEAAFANTRSVPVPVASAIPTAAVADQASIGLTVTGSDFQASPRPTEGTARDITSSLLVPSFLCHMSKTSQLMGYSPFSGRPIYQNQCSGACLSLIKAPHVCSPTYSKVQVSSVPIYPVEVSPIRNKQDSGATEVVFDDLRMPQITSTMLLVTSCGCKPKGCDVVNQFGVQVHYQHGATVIDGCDRKCTCNYGSLANCCRQRKDFRLGMTLDEKQRYLNAVKTLRQNPLYSAQYATLVQQHQTLFGAGIHNSHTFFPWHRYFILRLENLLQQIDCRITVPYWSWNKEASNPMGSSIWSPTVLGSNGNPGSGNCVTDGPFASPGFTITSGACLRRSFGWGGSASDADLASFMASNPNPSDYDSFRSTVEAGPGMHNSMHCNVGGTMCSSAAAEAPEFFLHHANIDRIWAKWQAQSAAHVTAYGLSGNLATPMPGGSVTASEVMDLSNQVGGIRVCYIATPFFAWLDPVLASIDLASIKKGSVFSSLEWMRIMKMSADEIEMVKAQEAARNADTLTRAQLLKYEDLTRVIGFEITDEMYTIAERGGVQFVSSSEEVCPSDMSP